MQDSTTPSEPALNQPFVASNKLEYTGDGTELALLMLKNLFLSIVTLGIYRAWATTNMRRYVWGHIGFLGDRAQYVGTGEELFKGWLKLIGLLIGLAILANLGALIVDAMKLLVPLAYVLIFAIATYSGLRYRMSRTKWRQIRFGVDKDKDSTQNFLKLYFTGLFLSIITLGIYSPWFKNNVRMFLTNRCRFGTIYFAYSGQGTEYAIMTFKGLFFSLLTLGFYIPWLIRDLFHYRLRHTHFQNAKFSFHLKGSDLLVFSLVGYFGVFLTLGLATPWIVNWGLKLFVTNIAVEGQIDLALVQSQASDGSAMADEIVSDYDLDLGF